MTADPIPSPDAGRRVDAGRPGRGVVGRALALLVLGAWSLLAASVPVPAASLSDVAVARCADGVDDEASRGWDVAQPAPVEVEGLAEERDPEEEEGPGTLLRAADFLRLEGGRSLAAFALATTRPVSASDRPSVRGPPAG